MLLSIPEIINILVIINLFIIFVILIFRKNNSTPNKILGFILLLPGISYINNYLILSRLIYYFPEIVFISQLAALICPLLIYYYVKIFIGNKKNIFDLLQIFTFLIAAYCITCLIKFEGYNPDQKKQFITNILHEIYPSNLVYMRGGFFILLNAYFIGISIQVWKYWKFVINCESGLEKIKLRYIIQFITIIWALNIVVMCAYLFIPNFYVDYIAVPIITGIFYIFILVTAFNHTAIFTKKDFIKFQDSVSQIDQHNLSYVNKKEFEPEKLNKINLRFAHLFEQEKIYKNPNLNIGILAEKLELTIHDTSFYINKYLKTSFFNLINEKRIELAKEMLIKNGINSEIEVIGYEVGFNSKSAFYRAFNKLVSQSPGEFICSHLKSI